MILQKDLKTVLIKNRNSDSYRVILLNHYFETEEEHFFDSFKEAEVFAELWLTTDRL